VFVAAMEDVLEVSRPYNPAKPVVFMDEKPFQYTSSLSRFAHKTPKNRLQGDFLPCKLPKHAQ
jgi:hypothetical protein